MGQPLTVITLFQSQTDNIKQTKTKTITKTKFNTWEEDP